MTQLSASRLTAEQLTGRSESHLSRMNCGHSMQAEAAWAFAQLQGDAREAGFDLAIVSAFRSFERQLAIWNGKASGQRPIHDDSGSPLNISEWSADELVHAIMRFSALPGTSRHHWGSDVDVYDQAAVSEDYAVQLVPIEVAAGGVFDAMHCWLDERIVMDESHGFFRPYASDNGGVAVERWHLSYAPLSLGCAQQLTAALVSECWNSCEETLLLRKELDAQLPSIIERYLAVEESWCPARYNADK
ncbi:MAG: LAS superfamily LD-carboxypeptidase LdcB [Halioglobus sp.]